ncbi:MAG: response regulator [Verrucomicrobia bacterium]|nr:response regulator [Verrucomicrobiota bacterium]
MHRPRSFNCLSVKQFYLYYNHAMVLSPHSSSPMIPTPLGAPTILVVDDDELNRDLISRQLQRAGLSASTAESGEVAMRSALEQPPQLALIDLHLGGWSGYETVAQFLAKPSLAHIIFFAISASETEQVVAKTKAAGFHAFFPKPLDFELLISAIRQALSPP